LPLYRNFLQHFVNRGYEFWSFSKYWNSDKNNLPEKLLVIRHDIHHRDIKLTYAAYLLENELLSDDCATYYILLDFPSEMEYDNYSEMKADYLYILNYLSNNYVDVQPHISIWDEYIYNYNPWWANYSKEKLMELKNQYYTIQHDNYYKINIIDKDTLDISDVNNKIIGLLEDYNQRWFNYIGQNVKHYANHGSSSAINHVINNNIIINQEFVRKSELFEFETSSFEINEYLTYLGDNYRPLWIENPQNIEDGRYHLLMHPYVWEDPQSYRDLNRLNN